MVLSAFLEALGLIASNTTTSTTSTSTTALAGSTARLPSYPLAVKSPYLSTWVAGNAVLSDASTAQPTFWNGVNLTWPVLARIDGKVYSLFGLPSHPGNVSVIPATTDSVSYTSSHTYILLTAGSVRITLDYFSPVLPAKQDYADHSLPYSYLTVSATGAGQEVQFMNAIDYTWTAQDGASELLYNGTGASDIFTFFNPEQILFTEVSDMATWGSVIFAASAGKGSAARCGSSEEVLGAFAGNGTVHSFSGEKGCGNMDWAAFSKDLGKVGPTAARVTFAVGYDRVDAIDYLGQPQTGFYRTKWPMIAEAVDYVFERYERVFACSLALDAALRTKAQSVSDSFGNQYADIVEASVRQTFGGMDLTVPANNLSSYPPSAFLKEISSDGNVNTMDFIFQSWPVFISLNVEYIRLLLEPILSYLQTGRFPRPYVIHDIGTHYPNATGHDNGVEESMPIFETSSLFILMHAYQKFSGDTSFVTTYAHLLDGYAEWLCHQRSLYPRKQLISVDAIRATANQTGLAVQAAIGLKAAAILTENTTYTDQAASNVNALWYGGLGLDGSSPSDSEHFTYNYGKDKTWNVLFPSYSDVLLELETFPPEAWEFQSSWYLKQMQQGGLPFAGPVDDLHYTGSPLNWGLTDWNIAAASVSSTEVQEAVINTTHTFLTNGQNSIPFGTKYIVEGEGTGKWIGNVNRASVGTHFALMALREGPISW